MTTLYCARWVLPVSLPPFADGAIAVDGDRIISVGERSALTKQFPHATVRDFDDSAIIPGLINTHSHLELTAMRGFLEGEEPDFFGWLKKLTIARLERMTADDLNVSAAWGAGEAARSGVTCLADASSSAGESMKALREIGLRGLVFQESFGPDPKLAQENFEKLRAQIEVLRDRETGLVKCGVSPHAPYSVCGPQLKLISKFAIDEGLSLMMHAAETEMEVALLREGQGPFADGLRKRGIGWQAPGVSPIRYLKDHGILETRPLLAHCIHIDQADMALLKQTGSKVAHCPKSNAKLGHGRAPLRKLLDFGIEVGLGSDSVASNNTCDLLEEARFGLLLSRSESGSGPPSRLIQAGEMLRTATLGGARALNLEGQVGELRAGLQADFAILSLDSAHQIPSYDPAATLIFSSSARDVRLTVVAGKEIYRDGELTTVDEPRLRARMSEIAGKLQG
ncbi:MAG TPA: amidohydrolase family protein [Pyrinomonadaceae bacterium]|nr:amidohydrolase family protein [Pyrinomonadaceae bacterium]